MPASKRQLSSNGRDDSPSSSDAEDSGVVDISTSITRKRPRTDTAEDGEDDLADFIQASIAKRSVKEGTQFIKNTKGKSKVTKDEVGGGSFQSMGLHPALLRSLTLQGYRIPTPIQRLAIPSLLSNPPRDLVGMARTGSGKSLAYMIPLLQRLGGRHSTSFGARGLILLPTRELALQVLKVGKELARGFSSGRGEHAGDKEDVESSQGSQNLRWGLVVGGESLDEQFEMVSNNPDVVIATPGRLLHLIVEMELDLKSVECVIFDEADRLFEMGFEVALTEILNRLPVSRQTILFSATLPKSLVEFAKAGLRDPKLVRLDAETKVSPDLRMAFFSVKQAEKEACLLSLLRDVIKVPLGSSYPAQDTGNAGTKKTGKHKHAEMAAAPHQTLIFAATKHHVEYLLNLLKAAGYSVSHIYGSLDQAARTHQMDLFRKGLTNILVVTDVAARGIDIPVLENVINYDFPQGARVFVHRVGRTARAGRLGWAWSFVTASELPYLLDLQLFLGKPIVTDVPAQTDEHYTESLVLGSFQRERIDEDVEYIRSLDMAHHSLPTLRDVMRRGQSMYERSKGKASPQSYKRAKTVMRTSDWTLSSSNSRIHPVLLRNDGRYRQPETDGVRQNLLNTLHSFTPTETVFEVGSKASSENAALMRERRKALAKSAQKAVVNVPIVDQEDEVSPSSSNRGVEMADENDIAAAFDIDSRSKSYKDDEFYMSHYQKDAVTEKGYSLTDGASSFVKQAQNVTFELTNDEGKADLSNKQVWDKKKKKFVRGDRAGADNVKMVRTENGTRLPATFRSGRFDEWKARNRVTLPRIGETENTSHIRNKSTSSTTPRFKHVKITPAKPLDKLSRDYERKLRQQKKKADAAEPLQDDKERSPGRKSLGSRRGKSYGRVKSELKTAEQIRKDRKIAERRKAKNARPARSAKRKGKR